MPVSPRNILLPLALGALLSSAATSPASAETACIARTGVTFRAPSDPPDATPRGHLARRECYTVVDRAAGQVRLLIPKATGMAAEVAVDESSLARVLVGDVSLTDSSGIAWGKVLSGALVAVESSSGDIARVITVEGRARVRFEVSRNDLFPAPSWPEPDPDISPDKGWPVLDGLLPASGTQLLGPEGEVRAEIRPALFAVDDLLLDPDFGQLRAEDTSKEGGPGALRIAGPSAWVAGVSADSSWLTSRGPDLSVGLPNVGLVTSGDRKVGTKPVSLYGSARGEVIGTLASGAWLRITEEDGGWALVSAAFSGGTIDGWLEKKRLLPVKKTPEPPAPASATLLANFSLGRSAVQWAEPEIHEEEELPELSLSPLAEAVAAKAESLRLVYAAELAADPAVSGELTLRLKVAPSGELLSTHVAVDKLGNSAIQTALLACLEGVAFERRTLSRSARRSKDSQELEVWLQIVFSSSGS